MKFIIAGAGSVGYDIARHLIKEGMDVVIIEKDPVRAKFLESDLDCIVLSREINSLQTLKDADIQAGDYFIAVTESDEVNLIACSIASTFENVKKIARVRNLEYSHAEVFGRPFLGADYVISPEIEAAKQITEIIDRGAATDVLTFEGTDITVRAGIIEKNSIFKNKSLMKIRREINRQFIIALIKRNDREIIPSGNTVLREGDTIFIVADSEAMNYILAKTGKKALKVKSALIVGTTRIARNLLRTLSTKPIDLKIVVEDYEEAKEISRSFPNVLVINGDVRNESVFEEEKLNEVDLIVTVTDNQELNVITALYAKSTGVDRAVAAVSKQSYMSIAQKLGVDVTVSPKKSAVDAIIKYIRRGNIKTFHSLLEGDAEAIEFIIPEKSFAKGKLIKDLKMPFDSIIAAISRKGQVFIPDGNFQLEPEDSIIVIMKSSVALKVETIFANVNEI
jgi:trk system potassium uptake protein